MNRKMYFLFLLFFSLSFTSVVHAQKKKKLSKEEKKELKEWSKKLKSMNPLEFKALYEEKQNLEQRINAARGESEQLQQQITERDQMISQLKTSNARLQTELSEVDVTDQVDTRGDSFRVQIVSSGKPYTLGYFKNAVDAENFKRFVFSMGLRQAQVAHFIDGKPVQN